MLQDGTREHKVVVARDPGHRHIAHQGFVVRSRWRLYQLGLGDVEPDHVQTQLPLDLKWNGRMLPPADIEDPKSRLQEVG